LSIVLNGDVANPIKKYINAQEGKGGDDNVISIALRNLDFASVDYHDYQQLGLNCAAIAIEPIDADDFKDCTLHLRAVSVEAS
jgi:hypothetical protein